MNKLEHSEAGNKVARELNRLGLKTIDDYIKADTMVSTLEASDRFNKRRS